MTRERIGLVVHSGRAAAVEAAGAVRRWASANDITVSDIDVWEPDWGQCHRRNAVDEAEAAGHPALVVTVGGDGTFLRGARIAAEDGVPVLGINVGRVGFLTEVDPTEIDAALDAFFSGQVHMDERLMLTLCASRPLEIPEGMQDLLRYGRGPLLPPPPLRQAGEPINRAGVALDVTALNDIVFEKLARDRQASLGVYLDESLFTSYSADALVVASPTGSTAYSFAAGGPILSPRLRALVLTPVAAHMVFNRSMVVAADEAVSVRVLDHSGAVAVSVDGQLRGVLNPGDWVTVQPAAQPAKLVRLHSSHFYSRLREKFSLAGAPAAIADTEPVPVEWR
ncbi:NAD(+)/NADH kinase [Micromonospora sp. NBC_01699]|uniref:NAD(+)/NADH kinase n=1 Tax=Micromonospora sp. NBC_01699 TaxID=2975984 RepID=UPI002E2ADDBC|nr:NAD(+)/NADH kinase [Micromonospora sp. NBC_01699]